MQLKIYNINAHLCHAGINLTRIIGSVGFYSKFSREDLRATYCYPVCPVVNNLPAQLFCKTTICHRYSNRLQYHFPP